MKSVIFHIEINKEDFARIKCDFQTWFRTRTSARVSFVLLSQSESAHEVNKRAVSWPEKFPERCPAALVEPERRKKRMYDSLCHCGTCVRSQRAAERRAIRDVLGPFSPDWDDDLVGHLQLGAGDSCRHCPCGWPQCA